MISKLVLLKFLILFIFPTSEVNGENVTSIFMTTEVEVQSRMKGRIVNGELAKGAQFPYMVSIQNLKTIKGHFCGGTLITDKWVVTAAHCLYRQKNPLEIRKLLVVAGEVNIKLSYSFYRQTRQVKKLIINPRYDWNMLTHDIGIILLQSPFLFTQYVFPIPLLNTTPKPGSMCTTTGWGYAAENGSISDMLMFVKLPIVASQECQKLLSGVIFVTPALICAGYLEGGKDACQGDSGGPLVCDNVLAGVVSGGRGCARPKLPGFYTSIPEYRRWIEQVLDSDGNNATYYGITKFPMNPTSNTTNVGGKSTRLLSNFHIIIFSLFIIILFIFT